MKKEIDRLGEERINYQGCLMKIVEYNSANDMVVEFQDDNNAKVNTYYHNFTVGRVKNPYYPSVYGVGIVGNKYVSSINRSHTKEYETWVSMLKRCFNKKIKKKQPTYKDVVCCDEWLFFENFYEWLHNQNNFDKWYNGERWCLDKDILFKGNKTYSPDTCCLVPNSVNVLFTKRKSKRGNLPIGVVKHNNLFRAECSSVFEKYHKYLGIYETPQKAFDVYKKYKEDLIKQIAKIEYEKANITDKCYNAMMNYKVEITD